MQLNVDLDADFESELEPLFELGEWPSPLPPIDASSHVTPSHAPLSTQEDSAAARAATLQPTCELPDLPAGAVVTSFAPLADADRHARGRPVQGSGASEEGGVTRGSGLDLHQRDSACWAKHVPCTDAKRPCTHGFVIHAERWLHKFCATCRREGLPVSSTFVRHLPEGIELANMQSRGFYTAHPDTRFRVIGTLATRPVVLCESHPPPSWPTIDPVYVGDGGEVVLRPSARGFYLVPSRAGTCLMRVDNRSDGAYPEADVVGSTPSTQDVAAARSDPLCWGHELASGAPQPRRCAKFQPPSVGKTKLVARFCAACRAGIVLPATRVRLCEPQANSKMPGLWGTGLVAQARHRHVQLHSSAHGEWGLAAVVFDRPLSLDWGTEVPTELCDAAGAVTLLPRQDSILLVAPASRASSRPESDLSTDDSVSAREPVQAPSAPPSPPLFVRRSLTTIHPLLVSGFGSVGTPWF